METPILAEAQRDLQRLRGSQRQSDIAKALGTDQSRISRLEKGEILLGEEELQSYLDAIGTDEAKEYREYLSQTWHNIQRPDFWNPTRQVLFRADTLLSQLDRFVAERNITSPLRAETDLLRQSLVDASGYLQNLDYRIAWVGDIGVGKSTALCTLAGLQLASKPGTSQDLARRVALFTNTGGATICEVRIKHRPDSPFGIIIQPQSMDEIFRAVDDLCEALMQKKDSGPTDSEQMGVSEETSRALRNMAGLTRKRGKTIDGKAPSSDPAVDLARQLGTVEKFRAEFFSRLGLPERTKCEIWHDGTSGISGLEWLQDTFAKVNAGNYPGVSLPRSIDILVPQPLFASSLYSIELIDTKGVDGTAIRPDIEAYIDNPRVLMVLCSRYNFAPDTSIQRLIQHVMDRGAVETLMKQGVLLVLPHRNEADNTRDDSGMFAESREESYAIKQDQVEGILARIHASTMPISFFNAEHDDPDKFAARLLELIEKMRIARIERIDEIAQTVQQLIDNFEDKQAEAVSIEARRRLSIFLQNQADLSSQKRKPYQALLGAVHEAHPRTIWATTRRNGTWGNLDVYHYLGAGVAIDARIRSKEVFHNLDTVITQMLDDPQLNQAYGFLNEVRRNVEQWKLRFLARVTTSGRELLRTALFEDHPLWETLEQQYGSGPGYRDEIRQLLENWFEDEERESILTAVEERVQQEWQTQVIQPLRELSGQPSEQ